MKIYLGADHRGFHLRNELRSYLERAGYKVEVEGEERLNPEDDYPTFAQQVVHKMQTSTEPDPRGILICGSGQGICMAANRFKGARAALLYDRQSARESRNDDDSNIACLPADVLKNDEANLIIETWLNTPFEPVERYKRRIRELDEMS